jgi:hypothetical protein
MSRPDLTDPRFDEIVHELREKAPPAPDALRERVAATASSEVRRRFVPPTLGRRRALVLATAAIVVLGLGAASINVLSGADEPTPQAGRMLGPARDASGGGGDALRRETQTAEKALSARGLPFGQTPTALPTGRRLQKYDAHMRLRVKDADTLDRATKSAMRETRRLGGFVASTNFETRPGNEGDATLGLRVPIDKVQDAIARFSDLGTIVTQRVTIDDLQTDADRLSRTIAEHRRRIAELRAKENRTPAEEIELQSRIAALQSATRRRAGIVREAAYATVTLELTTQDAVDRREEPGAFRTFWDDAREILVTELIWLLYALVVAGPFLLLGLLALLAERARRRRATDALLAHN